MPRSSSGLGHRPLTAVTRVQIPYGVQHEDPLGALSAEGIFGFGVKSQAAVGVCAYMETLPVVAKWFCKTAGREKPFRNYRQSQGHLPEYTLN